MMLAYHAADRALQNWLATTVAILPIRLPSHVAHQEMIFFCMVPHMAHRSIANRQLRPLIALRRRVRHKLWYGRTYVLTIRHFLASVARRHLCQHWTQAVHMAIMTDECGCSSP